MKPRQNPDGHATPTSASESTFRPLVFGEALFDHFPDGSRVPGGAPFNVAWHLRGFKADPLLVSAIGTDAQGREILKRMKPWGMDSRGVQLHPHRPTGRVSAQLQDGEPRFHIEPRQAYDEIDTRRLPSPPLLSEAQLLYHGTLALREYTSRRTLDYLRETLRCPVLLDVNLRDPWWNRADLEWALKGADCVKLNREEAGLLFGDPVESREEQLAAVDKLRTRYGIRQVVLTLGAEGALGVEDRESVHQEAPPVTDLQDTVGAGDAFSAVLALGIHHSWALAVTLERATVFAADLCRARGATHNDSSLYERHFLRWDHGK